MSNGTRKVPTALITLTIILAVLAGNVKAAHNPDGKPPIDRFMTWWSPCQPSQRPVLPPDLRQRVTTAANAYLAPNQEAAQIVADRLNFAPAAHPSNMCAPLAVAILRDAGLVRLQDDLSAYWLLNPRDHAQLLYHLFPPERFCYQHFSQPASLVDFEKFPLHVGDFLYLYAGGWGTFEHVLVVTRVDAQGRAYAVTNINLKPEGYYVVREVMLYDPNDPRAGMFAQWADYHYAAIGLTGLGGFDLWRPLPEAFSSSPRASWPRRRRPLPLPH